MDKKIYKRTRYQNIYYNMKKKNYIINFTRPNMTISEIDGNKIFDINSAIDLRNSYKSKINKMETKVVGNNTFEEIYNKYLDYSEKIELNSYKRLQKKKGQYNNYFYPLKDKRIVKITEKDIIELRDNWDCTDNWKNELLKVLKAFFNWCIKSKYIIYSPIASIKPIKVVVKEMKYWSIDEAKKFLNTLNNDISSNDFYVKYHAYTFKILVLLELNLGNRIGETRALRYCDLDYANNKINISHSISYDPRISEFYKEPKNMHSIRSLDVSKNLLDEIKKYKLFIENALMIKLEDTYPIIMNLESLKPYSDSLLRRLFNHYIDVAQVTKIRLYDLRHTYVATLMEQGWELYHISERLGHSNYNTTVNRYGHLSNKVRKEVAESTAKLF